MRNCVHGRAVARAMGLTAATVATLLAGTAAVAQQAPAAKDSTIRMSQLGFERAGPKIATIVDPATRPLPWRVVDAGGKTVASGNTEVFGRDAASGDHVHIARFQSLQAEGTGYLEVHVATPVDVCSTRDVKGLYAKQAAGELTGLTGVDDPYEAPEDPDLRLDAHGQSVAESAAALHTLLSERGLLI